MSKIFKKIICPVAFDHASSSAVDLASELADPHRSTIYLLHVVSTSSMETMLREPYPIITEEIARKELETVARHHLESQVPHRLVVRTGDPAGMIVAVAEELGADLIVMATHSGRDWSRLIFGSVAERVIKEAKQPVLTIRPHQS
jgi:nucleotide-binding universal stress UspA family protein